MTKLANHLGGRLRGGVHSARRRLLGGVRSAPHSLLGTSVRASSHLLGGLGSAGHAARHSAGSLHSKKTGCISMQAQQESRGLWGKACPAGRAEGIAALKMRGCPSSSSPQHAALALPCEQLQSMGLPFHLGILLPHI